MRRSGRRSGLSAFAAALGVDVDPLVVAGRLGELVHLLLGDRHPVAVAQVLPDQPPSTPSTPSTVVCAIGRPLCRSGCWLRRTPPHRLPAERRTGCCGSVPSTCRTAHFVRDGDRQPHPGLLLRPRRHLRAGRRRRAGRPGRGRGRGHGRRRRGEGRARRGGHAGRGDPPHRRPGRRRSAPRTRRCRSRSTPGGPRSPARRWRPAPTSSTTPGAGSTRSWRRSPPRPAPGIVCTHAGGLPPRTRPHRVGYDDVVADIVARTTALADGRRRRRGRPRAGADRPRARLRQEHPALAGGHPAAGRAGRHRLAGAGGAVATRTSSARPSTSRWRSG